MSEHTPATPAAEQPVVLSADVEGDRVLAGAERGDIAVVVEAPTGISAAELEEALEGVPESIERTTDRLAATETRTMSDAIDELDLSTDLDELSDDELSKLYVDLDELVGHGAMLREDHDRFEELHQRYQSAWRELENRAEDYVECPECGHAHWTFEHGGGPAECSGCGHMGGEDLQIEVHEAASGLIQGGA